MLIERHDLDVFTPPFEPGAERYTVPDDVRQRNQRRHRQQRIDQRAERQVQRAEKGKGKRTQPVRG